MRLRSSTPGGGMGAFQDKLLIVSERGINVRLDDDEPLPLLEWLRSWSIPALLVIAIGVAVGAACVASNALTALREDMAGRLDVQDKRFDDRLASALADAQRQTAQQATLLMTSADALNAKVDRLPETIDQAATQTVAALGSSISELRSTIAASAVNPVSVAPRRLAPVLVIRRRPPAEGRHLARRRRPARRYTAEAAPPVL